MEKKKIKFNWRRLDNTAKVFSLDDKNNTNTFRCSVILKEKIIIDYLEQALSLALTEYPIFRAKVGTGLFWNYLEYNSKMPIIEEENDIPCQHINFRKNNNYLFKISYFKNKINIDVFHALTDGAGAISFFKAIVYNYLDLINNSQSTKEDKHIIVNQQDEYLKNYEKNLKMNFESTDAFMLPGKIDKSINNTYHYILDIDSVKKVCKKYDISITEYLTSIYVYSFYKSYDKIIDKEIVISVPIDLRKHYQVKSLSNFFTCMNINSRMIENNLTEFDEVVKQVHKEFKNNLSEEKLKYYLARDVKLGTQLYLRLIPLFIKKLFMKYAGKLVSKSATSTLSNLGIIDVDDKYKDYIDNFLMLVMPGRIQKIKCTVCSYGKNLNVTINSNIDDNDFINAMSFLFKKQVGKFKLESNRYDD